MTRRPSPDQTLFPFVWEADPADASPEDDEPAEAPLRARVRAVRATVVLKELWGTEVKVRNHRARKPT